MYENENANPIGQDGALPKDAAPAEEEAAAPAPEEEEAPPEDAAAAGEVPARACLGPPLRACSLSYTSRLSTASLSTTRRVSHLARQSPSVEAH
jgi:hypothetical protein